MATISLESLFADPHLSEHHALARGEGRDDMDRLFGPLLLVGRRTVLPSMAITSADVLVSAAAHATKQRWNATGSSLARMMPNWSCEGVPLAKD